MSRTEAASQRMRDERKAQILRIAAEVFARQGVVSTRIGDLAEAAGMSQGLLYRYFANKEEVYAALLERASQSTISLAQAALEQPGSPWEQLHWLTEHLLLGMRQPTSLPIISQASAIASSAQEPLHRLGKVLFLVLRQLIVASQAKGQAVKGDPDQLAMLYCCCIQGLAGSQGLFREMTETDLPDADAVLHLLKA